MTYGNLKSEIDNNPVLPMFQSIQNNINTTPSEDIMLSITKDLNNNDIIHLPDTGTEILPVPGANKAYVFFLALLHLDATAGAYTTPEAYIAIRDGDNNPISNFFNIRGALTGGLDFIANTCPWVELGAGDLADLYLNSVTAPKNSALRIQGLGDPMTDGNVNNTMRVIVYYVIADL